MERRGAVIGASYNRRLRRRARSRGFHHPPSSTVSAFQVALLPGCRPRDGLGDAVLRPPPGRLRSNDVGHWHARRVRRPTVASLPASPGRPASRRPSGSCSCPPSRQHAVGEPTDHPQIACSVSRGTRPAGRGGRSRPRPLRALDRDRGDACRGRRARHVRRGATSTIRAIVSDVILDGRYLRCGGTIAPRAPSCGARLRPLQCVSRRRGRRARVDTSACSRPAIGRARAGRHPSVGSVSLQSSTASTPVDARSPIPRSSRCRAAARRDCQSRQHACAATSESDTGGRFWPRTVRTSRAIQTCRGRRIRPGVRDRGPHLLWAARARQARPCPPAHHTSHPALEPASNDELSGTETVGADVASAGYVALSSPTVPQDPSGYDDPAVSSCIPTGDGTCTAHRPTSGVNHLSPEKKKGSGALSESALVAFTAGLLRRLSHSARADCMAAPSRSVRGRLRRDERAEHPPAGPSLPLSRGREPSE